MPHQLRLGLSLAIVFAFYVASNFATVALVPAVYGIPCEVRLLSAVCAFQPDTAAEMDSYLLLASIVALTMIAMRLFWRETVIYPFVMMFGTLAMAAIALDVSADNPVINGPKITNDTVNILGTVIAASFTLLIVILRHQKYTLFSVVRAASASYFVKVISVTAFISVRGGVHGATELFLLYIVYAFGAFSLHLMTICGFIARTAAAERDAAPTGVLGAV